MKHACVKFHNGAEGCMKILSGKVPSCVLRSCVHQANEKQ